MRRMDGIVGRVFFGEVRCAREEFELELGRSRARVGTSAVSERGASEGGVDSGSGFGWERVGAETRRKKGECGAGLAREAFMGTLSARLGLEGGGGRSRVEIGVDTDDAWEE